ncbi:hypothetical protein U1Q18_019629 [Sarracenia purpurea var. burkii]
MVIATLTGTLISSHLVSMVLGGVAGGGRWQRRLRDFYRDILDLASVWCLAVDDVVAPAMSNGGRHRGYRRERRWLKYPGTGVCLGSG